MENKPMIKPITPNEAIKSAKPDIPPEVFEVFNEPIVKGMECGIPQATLLR